MKRLRSYFAEGSTNLRSISRDPFARGTIVRCIQVWRDSLYKWRDAKKTCSWCGGIKRTPKGYPFLYCYGWNDDSKARIEWDKELFCSIGCRRSFHS